MTLAALLLGAAVLDGVTMLLLPAGTERNPLASSYPYIAFGLKVAVAGLLSYLVLHRTRYFRGVAIFGTAAWMAGAVMNLLVIA